MIFVVVNLLYWLIIAYFVCCLVIFTTADSDLTLYLYERFGKSPESLAGKVIWITGASSGIGEYLAYRLAAAGCRLVLSARREEELKRVKTTCHGRNTKLKDEDVFILTLDSSKFETHQNAVDKVINHFKKIDVLVNNAGRSQRAEAAETDILVDQEVMKINHFGVLSLTKCVLPHMRRARSGHIVTNSSIAGKLGAPFSGSYTASKHALQGWFDTLRVEQYSENIQVTMVCPGPVLSNITSEGFTEKPGQKYGVQMKSTEKRMITGRCAQLIAVAMANKLDEAWISEHPVLLFAYVSQYCPSIAKKLSNIVGYRLLKRLREGQSPWGENK